MAHRRRKSWKVWRNKRRIFLTSKYISSCWHNLTSEKGDWWPLWLVGVGTFSTWQGPATSGPPAGSFKFRRSSRRNFRNICFVRSIHCSIFSSMLAISKTVARLCSSMQLQSESNCKQVHFDDTESKFHCKMLVKKTDGRLWGHSICLSVTWGIPNSKAQVLPKFTLWQYFVTKFTSIPLVTEAVVYFSHSLWTRWPVVSKGAYPTCKYFAPYCSYAFSPMKIGEWL